MRNDFGSSPKLDPVESRMVEGCRGGHVLPSTPPACCKDDGAEWFWDELLGAVLCTNCGLDEQGDSRYLDDTPDPERARKRKEQMDASLPAPISADTIDKTFLSSILYHGMKIVADGANPPFIEHDYGPDNMCTVCGAWLINVIRGLRLPKCHRAILPEYAQLKQEIYEEHQHPLRSSQGSDYVKPLEEAERKPDWFEHRQALQWHSTVLARTSTT